MAHAWSDSVTRLASSRTASQPSPWSSPTHEGQDGAVHALECSAARRRPGDRALELTQLDEEQVRPRAFAGSRDQRLHGSSGSASSRTLFA